MMRLADPRVYAAGHGGNELARLAALACDGDGAAAVDLRAQVRRCLRAEDDARPYAALAAATSHDVYRTLWSTISGAVESPEEDGDTAIVARRFAIPIVVVAGARFPTIVSGSLSDIATVHALLEREGAVGTTRNFGLSAALVPLDALERLHPSRVYRWNHDYSGATVDGLEGAAIEVAPGREQAHLRFLVGAGITPAHLPSFIETAADTGRWGTSFTRTLARQLAQDGLELLPLARPPRALLDAPQHGRCDALATAFELFASHAVRTCRLTAGEPAVMVTAHREGAAAELRVSVSSLLDDTLLEGFRWPLHPIDDLDAIVSSIAGLLEACRVTDVRWAPGVVDVRSSDAAPSFISVRDFDRIAAAPH